MNKCFLLLFLFKSSFQTQTQTQIIKNIELPSCRNCIYYKPYSLGEYTSDLSKCEKFGTKNILTDKITHDYADLCRRDEDKCGKKGKYFEEEVNMDLKITKHKIVQYSPLFSIFIFWCFYLWLNISLYEK